MPWGRGCRPGRWMRAVAEDDLAHPAVGLGSEADDVGVAVGHVAHPAVGQPSWGGRETQEADLQAGAGVHGQLEGHVRRPHFQQRGAAQSWDLQLQGESGGYCPGQSRARPPPLLKGGVGTPQTPSSTGEPQPAPSPPAPAAHPPCRGQGLSTLSPALGGVCPPAPPLPALARGRLPLPPQARLYLEEGGELGAPLDARDHPANGLEGGLQLHGLLGAAQLLGQAGGEDRAGVGTDPAGARPQ